MLTQAVWQAIGKTLTPNDLSRIVYEEANRLTPPRLKRLNAVFRPIPYDIWML